jgi:hypothetical protein
MKSWIRVKVRSVQLCFDFYMIEAKPENLIGDRAYGSDPLDAELRKDGIEMIAPHRGNRSKLPTQDRRRLSRYMRRWLVERFFAWIQWQRRILIRWEYHAHNFLGFGRVECEVQRSRLVRQLEPLTTCGSRHIVGVRDGIDHTERVPPVFNIYELATRSDFGSSGRQLFCARLPSHLSARAKSNSVLRCGLAIINAEPRTYLASNFADALARMPEVRIMGRSVPKPWQQLNVLIAAEQALAPARHG